jgi:hypothetical protein
MSCLLEAIDRRNCNIPDGRSVPDRLKKNSGAKKATANGPFCDSLSFMKGGVEALSDDVEALKAALIVARAEAAAAALNNPTTKR